MITTRRVKDLKGNTVGFIVDGKFHTDYIVKENIHLVENLKLTKGGKIRAKRKLLNLLS